ncbi:Acetyltransferase [hydrothermal vent metagenome]|uniref:Acetyltransferase n=1 Tax=hydrothermal vent metagenome TaxID=652676 RepID=A0A1W1BXD0_9ZZZZ
MNRKYNNFDLLRLILSIIVVIVHTAELSQIEAMARFSRYFSSVIAVDSFFIVSGFLIFMSFDNSSSLYSFAIKRVRRIAPAYSVVILLSSLILFFVSTQSFDSYFNIEFIRYIFFNLITLNFLQPTINGLFADNHIQAINGALWTIKIEVSFYIIVPIIGYLLHKTNKLFLLTTIYTLSISYSLILFWLYQTSSLEIYLKLEKQIFGQLAFFVSGALIYYFYDTFKKRSIYLLIISIIILWVHHFIINIYFLYPIALAISIIYFATQFKYLGDFGKYGDISFGIYIWHFPIIQVFVHYHLFDNLLLGLILLIISLLTISLLSWHFIEKRFLYTTSHYRR